MLAEFDIRILPGLVTLALMVVLLIVVLLTPLRTQDEIDEREAKKREKRKCSTDVLNVESKGDS